MIPGTEIGGGSGQNPGRRYEAPIALVGDDVGWLATLEVLLEQTCGPIDAVSSIGDLLARPTAAPPLATLFDEKLGLIAGGVRVTKLRWPASPVFVLAPGPQPLPTEAIAYADATYVKPAGVAALRTRLAAIARSGSSHAGSPPPLSPRILAAIEYVGRFYGDAITVRRIAAAVGVSESRLGHRFPQETGSALKEYVTRVRLEVAKRLLLETDRKLADIAETVGFVDASHLSRVFVIYTGARPGEYRAQARA